MSAGEPNWMVNTTVTSLPLVDWGGQPDYRDDSLPMSPAPLSLERKLDALMALLGLPPQARAFVEYLAANPGDRDTLLVFADWLEEQRHPAAERMRQVAEGA